MVKRAGILVLDNHGKGIYNINMTDIQPKRLGEPMDQVIYIRLNESLMRHLKKHKNKANQTRAQKWSPYLRDLLGKASGY